jgi:translation initiation factor IF-2
MEIKADHKGELEAVIIESRSDSKKGIVVSVIVKNGTLKVGDDVFASGHVARIKSLTDNNGKLLTEAGPSTPVEILGFSKVPNVGDLLVKKGSELSELAVDENRVEIVGKSAKKTIAVVIRADTQGTLEAVKASLASLVTESVGATFALKFLLTTTGDVTDSDVLLAYNAKGLVIGFNVRVPSAIADLAENLKVPVKTYKTIYDLTDEVKDLLEGTAFDAEAKIKGRAKVQKIFKLPSGDIIAGCKVLAGVLKEGSKVSIYDKDPSDLKKEDLPLYTGNIHKLKRGKDDVALVGKDNECGVLLKPQFEAIAVDTWIEVR